MAKFHSLKVKDIRQETADCVSVAFEVPESLQNDYRFVQGQNLTLRETMDGEEVRRSYSICTSPGEGELRVAIKKASGGKFSTFANEQLKPGDKLDVMTPTGHFYTDLDPQQAKYYVAFAAGSGITPIMSIMKTVLEREPKSEFTLFFGNQTVSSIIFREAIEGLKNKYMNRLQVYHILSREKMDAPLFFGRISGEKCHQLLDHLLDVKSVDEFFLCGPEEMIDQVRSTLEHAGVDSRKIHFELFTTPTSQKAPKRDGAASNGGATAWKSRVTAILDGLTFDFDVSSDGDSILNEAMKNGADVPFACKGGVCCTCKAKLIEGKVEMDVNYGLEASEVEKGFILTCQSHPVSERVIVDYDQI